MHSECLKKITAVLLLWATAFPIQSAYAIMDCSLLERRIEAQIEYESAFSSSTKYTEFEVKAKQLLEIREGGKTLLELHLEKQSGSVEDILPKDPLGIAAFYSVFSNYRSQHKIEIGKYLTMKESELPSAVASSVRNLKNWLLTNPIVAVEITGNGIRLKQNNAKWFKNMQRFIELSYTVEEYARLSSFESQTVRAKITSGFLNFFKTRRGAYVQRKVVEKELLKDNFKNSLSLLGLMNSSSPSVRFREGIQKYSNILTNAFNAAMFGGINIAVAQAGVPINYMWMAAGMVPLKYSLKVPANKRAEILEIVRNKGYEAGLKEIQPYFTSRRVADRSSAFIRKALQLTMIAVLMYYLNEYGPTAYSGLMTYLSFRDIMANPEELALTEGQMTDEDIRLEMLENKIIEYPDIFGIYPDDEISFKRVIRSAEFVKKAALSDLVTVICKKSGPSDRVEQEKFILERYDSSIDSMDLDLKFIRLMGTTIFSLWQDMDVSKDIRAFSERSLKQEIDFCAPNYKPEIFKGESIEQAILDYL